MIIDTHAHLTDEHFADLEKFLASAADAGVSGMLTVATTAADSKQCVALCEKHSQIRAAVGIHPNTCCRSGADDWASIVALIRHPQVAALGETGLDRHWDDCPWEVQLDYFRRHLALSRKSGLPVVIHTRDCGEECLELLREEAKLGPLNGVMHSFTGTQMVADGCLELGLYISFAGMVTFKNADEIRKVAKEIPDDRILIETDSPYLTPHPHRGKRPNHPAMVVHTLTLLAEVRGERPEDFAALTSQNAQKLFGKWNV